MYFLNSSYRQDSLPGDVGLEVGLKHTARFHGVLTVSPVAAPKRGTGNREVFWRREHWASTE